MCVLVIYYYFRQANAKKGRGGIPLACHTQEGGAWHHEGGDQVEEGGGGGGGRKEKHEFLCNRQQVGIVQLNNKSADTELLHLFVSDVSLQFHVLSPSSYFVWY